MHYKFIELMQVNFIETNPQPVKTALAMMGKLEENFHLPLVSMNHRNKQKLNSVLRKYKLV